LSYGNVNL